MSTFYIFLLLLIMLTVSGLSSITIYPSCIFCLLYYDKAIDYICTDKVSKFTEN